MQISTIIRSKPYVSANSAYAKREENSLLHTHLHIINRLFVTTDMELSSAPVTPQPSGPIHPPVLISTHSPGAEPGPELYGSGFAQEDDPTTSNSLKSFPGVPEGKAHRQAASMMC